MTKLNTDSYVERISSCEAARDELKKKGLFLAVVKVAIVGVAIVLLLLDLLTPLIFACFVAAFMVAALVHERILKKQKHLEEIKTINQDELEHLDYGYPNTDYGDCFSDTAHPYSSDMDMFAEHGLFHYINRCQTILGKNRLAQRLKAGSPIDKICGLHEAVRELTPMLDFRQELMVLGSKPGDSLRSLDALYNLFKEPPYLMGKQKLRPFLYIIPLLTLAVLAAAFFSKYAILAFLGMFVSQMVINKLTFKRVSGIFYFTRKQFKSLTAYSRLIAKIERESFVSDELKTLQKKLTKRLTGKDKPASFYIKKMATLLEWSEIRYNPFFYFFVNNMFLWDLNLLLLMEKRKEFMKEEIGQWLDVIGEMEVLSSFANLSFNNPDWTMPGFRESGFAMEAESLGHPLLPAGERICNDFKLDERGNIAIITGPNMAGKSTFLRTVGVNTVLALAGAPVCAKSFRLSSVKLYTSMKISDSLDKKMSLFYSELQRLKMILDAIINGEPVFFIIDEMLKGTNTMDRQKGAIALIRQLLKKEAKGIVATHDLELANLEAELPDRIRNFHFDGYVEGEKLLFDYALKAGVCASFNAQALMKKMGIRI